MLMRSVRMPRGASEYSEVFFMVADIRRMGSSFFRQRSTGDYREPQEEGQEGYKREEAKKGQQNKANEERKAQETQAQAVISGWIDT